MERTHPVVTAFGPVRNPGDNVYPLHRPVVTDEQRDIARKYRERCDAVDHHAGFVRPMDPQVTAAIMGEEVDLYSSLEEAARRAAVEADERRDLRFHRLQSFIHWACIGIALGTMAYFMLRGAF